VVNTGTKNSAILEFTIPDGMPGAPGEGGPGKVVFAGSIHQDALKAAGVEFVPLNSTGDPTGSGQHPLFAENATLMPVSCTSLTLFAFQGSQSGDAVTVTLYKSEGGTGAEASTGLSVTVGNGAGAHADLAQAINPGDLLSYQVSGPSIANNGLKLSVSLICH
jgi:hypothetical protein